MATKNNFPTNLQTFFWLHKFGSQWISCYQFNFFFNFWLPSFSNSMKLKIFWLPTAQVLLPTESSANFFVFKFFVWLPSQRQLPYKFTKIFVSTVWLPKCLLLPIYFFKKKTCYQLNNFLKNLIFATKVLLPISYQFPTFFFSSATKPYFPSCYQCIWLRLTCKSVARTFSQRDKLRNLNKKKENL